jgi:hypothetical protein
MIVENRSSRGLYVPGPGSFDFNESRDRFTWTMTVGMVGLPVAAYYQTSSYI